MTFKNKEELVILLHIAFLKNDFRLKKVINLSKVFHFRCANPDYKWWLRAMKYLSSNIFVINVYEKYKTYGLDQITIHNPYATAKVLG